MVPTHKIRKTFGRRRLHKKYFFPENV